MKVSEAGFRKDTLSLVVAGNNRVRQAASLLRKRPTDKFGEGWVRKPEDWAEIEQRLADAIRHYERARKIAEHRAEVVRREGESR